MSIIHKRFTGNSNKRILSEDFGLKLIEKEAELERDCNVDIIQDLVQLYTEAVEYYSYIKDKKYNDFQNRMHKMFLRPDVINAMKQNIPSSSQKKNTSMQQRKLESDNIKTAQSAIAVNHVHNQNTKNLTRIIEYSKLRNIEIARKAALDFKLQDQDLEKRLNSRKKSMLTKSMDSSRHINRSIIDDKNLKTVSEESDSQTSSFVKFIEEEEIDIEAELEKIMEKYCMEKAIGIAQVTLKYETQIKEMDGDGIIMEQIRQQLRKDMQCELLEFSNEIEQRKVEEIYRLKGGHRKNSLSMY